MIFGTAYSSIQVLRIRGAKKESHGVLDTTGTSDKTSNGR